MPASPAPDRRPSTGVDDLVGRLRSVHLEMIDAVLSGEGAERVAELAAAAAQGPVAIVFPRLGGSAIAPGDAVGAGRLAELRRYVGERLRERPARVPAGVVHEASIVSGGQPLGAVLLLEGAAPAAPEAAEFLHLAAVVCLTDVAIEEAREEVEHNLRGSLLEDLRERGELEGEEILRRAQRVGCDLSAGAVALCAELAGGRPRHVVATIAAEHPGALAQQVGERVYALLPAASSGSAGQTLSAARALAESLQRRGTVGLSSFYADPGDVARALDEAELVLDVVRRSGVAVSEGMGEGAYRLLFRVLASHPEEVRSFYEATVAPLVAYDAQYRTDLTGTLEAYLEHNCSVRATAAAIFAHRHTVSYRLDRVRELTGLDAAQSEDRERLGLGLKAYRVIAPRLPR